MPAFIAYMTGILALISTVAAVAGGGSFTYGAFHWLQGDHQQGKKWIVGALIGVGVLLCSSAMGTALAAIPHA